MFSIKGSTLKIIAVFAMITDHIGACILQRILDNHGILSTATLGINTIINLDGNNRRLAITWWIMRIVIGRIAFPIYCFLLTQGFVHTKNVLKYAIRLLVFAVLSEIPFDLAIYGQPVNILHQNVFFTLFIGLICICAVSYADNKHNGNVFIKIFIACIGMLAAQLLNTDYGAAGVAFILLLYILRHHGSLLIAVGCISSVIMLNELAAILSFVFIAGYSGERGLKCKYIFYIIYPLHLIILYVVCLLTGLST